jgi:hypothetical protein
MPTKLAEILASRAPVPQRVSWRSRSEKSFELFDVETGIACDASHRESIYWIVARNRHNSDAIRHHDMLALAHDAKAGFFQRLDGIQMIDAGDLWHG